MLGEKVDIGDGITDGSCDCEFMGPEEGECDELGLGGGVDNVDGKFDGW
jgi:hypothetical protein